jgi:hypothetical protein
MEYLKRKIDQLEANSKNMNINRHVQVQKCAFEFEIKTHKVLIKSQHNLFQQEVEC